MQGTNEWNKEQIMFWEQMLIVPTNNNDGRLLRKLNKLLNPSELVTFNNDLKSKTKKRKKEKDSILKNSLRLDPLKTIEEFEINNFDKKVLFRCSTIWLTLKGASFTLH